MDCEKLSPNAQKIFNQIASHFPSNPWGRQMWSVDGIIEDNGVYDLRKGEDRGKLIARYESQIGNAVVLFARSRVYKKEELTPEVFSFNLSKKWIEIAVLLYKLDFQIEIWDLME